MDSYESGTVLFEISAIKHMYFLKCKLFLYIESFILQIALVYAESRCSMAQQYTQIKTHESIAIY